MMEEPKHEDVTNIASNIYEDESMVRLPPMNEIMQTKRD
jgi:N-acetyl-gamma-glutamylphosphate reductase